MAITFVTGTPGHGKSLWSIWTIEAIRQKEHRPVYYSGIKDVTLPWKPLPLAADWRTTEEIEKGSPVYGPPIWDEVETGAIVMIDEAWQTFPTRGPSKPIPPYVQFLAIHRKRGFDIFIVTQQITSQVDTFLRGLAGRHVHLERPHGMPYAVVYDWPKLSDPGSRTDLAAAQSKRWRYKKKYFNAYFSAQEHNVRVTLPWKMLIKFGAATAVAAGGFALLFYRFSPHKPEVTRALDSSGRAQGVVAGAPSVLPNAAEDFWVKSRRLRVSGIPASAPLYDPLQKVRSQPRPEGCMQLSIGKTIRCECTGPNHSQLEMTLSECMSLVKRGWFDETKSYADARQENINRLNAERAGVVEGGEQGR